MHADCLKEMERLKKLPAYLWFQDPVDPVKLQIPTYFDVIKKPMDFGTITRKLASGTYTSVQAFRDDLLLVVNNAIQFNPADHQCHIDALRLRTIISTNLSKLISSHTPRSKALTPSASTPSLVSLFDLPITSTGPTAALFASCEAIVQACCEKDVQKWFAQPIHPENDGIPHYRTTIKEPMDLSTVRSNLRAHKFVASLPAPISRAQLCFLCRYGSLASFLKDMRLVWSNAITFNAAGTQVHCDARLLSVEFERLQRTHFTKAASTPKPVTPIAPATPTASGAPTAVLAPPGLGDRAPSGIRIGPLVNTGASKFLFGHCSAALEALKHRDNKQWFQVPVDPIKHGCPTYFDIIKHPMDLGTITEKLNTGKYLLLDEFSTDVRTVWDNAIKFNPPEHLVHKEAVELLSVFEKRLARIISMVQASDQSAGSGQKRARDDAFVAAPPSSKSKAATPTGAETLSAEGRLKNVFNHCDQILLALKNSRDSAPFWKPVDPVADGVPDYYSVVKKPMDLGTVQTKLHGRGYKSSDDFVADVRQVWANCKSFNGPGFFYDLAASFEKMCETRFKSIPKPPPAPVKKQILKPLPSSFVSPRPAASPMASSSGTPKAKTPAPSYSTPQARETDEEREEREYREFQEWKRFKELKNKSGPSSTPTSSHKSSSSSKAATPRPGGPSPSASHPSVKKSAGPPSKAGTLDMKEKERIVAMISDLDENHQSKIYEIIEKHQPTLLSGSTECDIEVQQRVLSWPWRGSCFLYLFLFFFLFLSFPPPFFNPLSQHFPRLSRSITPLSLSSVSSANASLAPTDSLPAAPVVTFFSSTSATSSPPHLGLSPTLPTAALPTPVSQPAVRLCPPPAPCALALWPIIAPACAALPLPSKRWSIGARESWTEGLKCTWRGTGKTGRRLWR